MPTPDQIRTTVTAYAQAMSSGDKQGWVALFAPDATVEDPVGAEVRTGHEQIGEFWDFVHTLSAEIAFEVHGPVRIAGSEAAFAGRAVSGAGDERLAVDLVDVMAFDDEGRITSLRAFWGPENMGPLEG